MKPNLITVVFLRNETEDHLSSSGWLFAQHAETIIDEMVELNVETLEQGTPQYSFDMFINGFPVSIDGDHPEFDMEYDMDDELEVPEDLVELGHYIFAAVKVRTRTAIESLQ